MRKEKHYRLCDMTLDELIYRNLDASHDFYERLKQRIKEYKPKLLEKLGSLGKKEESTA